MKKQILTAVLCGVLAVALCAGCGNNGSNSNSNAADNNESAVSETTKTTLKIGTTATNEKVTEAIRDALAEQGYEMEIVMFGDPVQPNTALDANEIDASFNEHEAYMQTFNDEQGYNLKFLGPILFGPFCCYSSKYDSIDALPENAQITICSDASNKDRTLAMLQDAGLIKLADAPQFGSYYVVEDIVENPKNVSFIELEEPNVPTTLADVDMIVAYNPTMYAGNYDRSGLLYTENYNDGLSSLAQGVVINGDNANEPWVADLWAAFTSETAKKSLEEVNDGSFLVVIP